MITYDSKWGTVSVPVEFTEGVEITEIFSEILLEKKITLDYSKPGSNPNSPAARMKKAFDDAGIKMKPKAGKIVVAKKDKEKASGILGKLMYNANITALNQKDKKIIDAALDKFFIFEEVEIDEAREFWAVIDKAKGGEVMAISSDEKGAKSSVKMSNFSKHDYHFNKDPRTLKIVKVAGSYKKGEKMIGTKLSFKEEVEVEEGLKKFKETLKGLTTEKVKRLEKEGAAEFMAAASAAKKAGKKKFTFGGKEHPVTIKTHIPLAKEEVDLYIQHVSGFDSFITEGRPALDPNYIHPADGVPDTERRRLVQSQRKRYKLSDIESIARKHKVKLELSKYSENRPIQFDDEWTLKTNKGIGLIYDYRSNDTTISGWRIDKNKLRQYKDKYESQDARMNDLDVRPGRVIVSGFESAFELIGESLKEDAPVNATGVNVVGTGDDPTVWKRKKKKTIKTEEFGGKKVFVVDPQKYWDSRLGKSRYSRYEKYVGNDAIGEAIREYGLSNPKAPIILKNSKTGAMLYLKYGNSNA
jgi:hypothetical protein